MTEETRKPDYAEIPLLDPAQTRWTFGIGYDTQAAKMTPSGPENPSLRVDPWLLTVPGHIYVDRLSARGIDDRTYLHAEEALLAAYGIGAAQVINAKRTNAELNAAHNVAVAVIADLMRQKAEAVELRDQWVSAAQVDRDRAERYRSALSAVILTINDENGLNDGSIVDTVWHGPGETLVDFITATLIEPTVAEQFDVTKPRDVRQDALLAIDVLARFADHVGPFTHADAAAMVGTIRRLLAAHDATAERLERTEEARDKVMAGAAELEMKLAAAWDQAEEMERRAEVAEQALADMTAERDAAAENARREREDGKRFRRLVVRQADWTDAEVVRVFPSQVRNVARAVVLGANPEYPPFGDYPIAAKPRVRVVTSPRFYSNDQAKAAWEKLCDGMNENFRGSAIIDSIAEALGMKRAPQ